MNITEKDIMIGDWVQYGDIHPVKTRVLGISSVDNGKHWHIQVEPESPNSMRIVAVHAVEPIPLSSEILEKNGFEKVNGEYQDVFYCCDGLDLLIDDRLEPFGYTLYGVLELPIYGVLELLIRYVHELQHALRLAGIDKEITI